MTAPGNKYTPGRGAEPERLFGVADVTEDQLTEILETYHIPEARARARWAKQHLWAWRATHAALAVQQWLEANLVRDRQEGLDVLNALRNFIVKDEAIGALTKDK